MIETVDRLADERGSLSFGRRVTRAASGKKLIRVSNLIDGKTRSDQFDERSERRVDYVRRIRE
jgi:hypothetical protein